MNDVERKASHEVEEARKGFEKAKQQAGETAEEFLGKSEKTWEETKAAGREAWKNARVRGQEWIGTLSSQSGRNWNNVRRFIQERPGQAVGIILGVGIVLGGLLFRRSKD